MINATPHFIDFICTVYVCYMFFFQYNKFFSTIEIGIGVNNITVNGIPEYIINLVIISNLEIPQNEIHSVVCSCFCFLISNCLPILSSLIPNILPTMK